MTNFIGDGESTVVAGYIGYGYGGALRNNSKTIMNGSVGKGCGEEKVIPAGARMVENGSAFDGGLRVGDEKVIHVH